MQVEKLPIAEYILKPDVQLGEIMNTPDDAQVANFVEIGL